MFDGEKFGQEMVEIIKGYVQGELRPIRHRLTQLEELIGAPDPHGRR